MSPTTSPTASAAGGQLCEKAAIGAKRKRPDDLGAYETYLLAQETMHSDLSDAHMIEGQKLLEQAIAKDPTLARAYVRYAGPLPGASPMRAMRRELMKQMVIYARKGVELDPMDADAHAALGYSLTLTGDLDQGEAQFDEALRLNPNAFDLLVTYSCMAHNYGKRNAAPRAPTGLSPSILIIQLVDPLPQTRHVHGRPL